MAEEPVVEENQESNPPPSELEAENLEVASDAILEEKDEEYNSDELPEDEPADSEPVSFMTKQHYSYCCL